MRSSSHHGAVLTTYAQSLIRFKAKQLSRKPGFSRTDEEDVAQELTAYLLSRAHLFDPRRASADTFADRVIRTAKAMLLRDRRRQQHARHQHQCPSHRHAPFRPRQRLSLIAPRFVYSVPLNPLSRRPPARLDPVRPLSRPDG